MRAADQAGLTGALMDRLRLDDARLEGIADQLRELADVPPEPSSRVIREAARRRWSRRSAAGRSA